jgi:site-specific recombinase XerD
MPRTPRRRIAAGVYRDKYSLMASVRIGSGADAVGREKAFAWDTPLEEIQRWQERTRVELHADRPIKVRGTLATDVDAYLERVRKRPASWKSKRSELKAWVAELGHKRRHTITPSDIDRTIATWRDAGVALKTIVNRCRTLHHLYVTLANDKRARTPLDNVDVPKPPKRRPAFVAAQTIVRVEKKLRKGDAKVRARFMVIAATGIRPSQLARLTAADVNLKHGLVIVDGGKGGDPIVHALNDDMRAAWRVFIAANAWGPFDATKFARAVRAAGWPRAVRVYNAKHAVGIELAERGADNEDIRAWFGHTDPQTTKIYTGVPLSRMKRLSQKIAGRLGWATAPRDAPRADGQKKSKEVKSRTNSRTRETA